MFKLLRRLSILTLSRLKTFLIVLHLFWWQTVGRWKGLYCDGIISGLINYSTYRKKAIIFTNFPKRHVVRTVIECNQGYTHGCFFKWSWSHSVFVTHYVNIFTRGQNSLLRVVCFFMLARKLVERNNMCLPVLFVQIMLAARPLTLKLVR